MRRLVALGLCGCLMTAAAAADHPAAPPNDTIAQLTRSIAQEEQRHGPDTPSLLPLLDELAKAQFCAGDLAAVVDVRRRALRIALHSFAPDAPNAVEAMTWLAEAYSDRRLYGDAEPLSIAASIAAQAALSAGAWMDPALASAAFATRARIAVARGDAAGAEPWADEALSLAKKNPRPTSSEPWRVLAALRTAEDRYPEAEALLRDALARDRSGEPGATARDLSQLGGVYLRQKRFAEALPVLQEAAALDQSALAPTHPLIAEDFADLGLAYDGLHREPAARRMLAFALKLLQQGSEKARPRLAYVELEYARVLHDQGDDAAAEAAFDHAHAILKRAERDDHNRETSL